MVMKKRKGMRKQGLRMTVTSNTSDAIKGLDEMTEMGFTKKSTSTTRKKSDTFARIGL